jgi:uncharacterized membrane protein YhaH (DUF805 family)
MRYIRVTEWIDMNSLPFAFLQNLISLKGRLNRGQWWLHTFVFAPSALLILAFVSPLMTLLIMETKNKAILSIVGIISALMMLACIYGAIAIVFSAAVRRHHDQGKSAWWLLLHLAPGLGTIWAIIEYGLLPGQDHDNQYGPVPGKKAVSSTSPKPMVQMPEQAQVAVTQPGRLPQFDRRGNPLSTGQRIALQEARRRQSHKH